MTATRVHANNFSTTLSVAITSTSATSATITSSTGLPTLSGGNFFYLTLESGSTREIVKVTAYSGTAITTMVRSQEGTTAATFAIGSTASLRPTANSIDRKTDAPASSTTNGLAYFTDTTGLVLGSTTTPVLGTPASGTLTNCTGLPAVAGISATGTPSSSTYLRGDGSWNTPSGGGGGGITMNTVTGTSQTAISNNGYISTGSGQCSVTLPATAAIGDIVKIVSAGIGGIKVIANTGQIIQGLGTATSSAGNIICSQYDSITVICITANTTWTIDSLQSVLITFA